MVGGLEEIRTPDLCNANVLDAAPHFVWTMGESNSRNYNANVAHYHYVNGPIMRPTLYQLSYKPRKILPMPQISNTTNISIYSTVFIGLLVLIGSILLW